MPKRVFQEFRKSPDCFALIAKTTKDGNTIFRSFVMKCSENNRHKECLNPWGKFKRRSMLVFSRTDLRQFKRVPMSAFSRIDQASIFQNLFAIEAPYFQKVCIKRYYFALFNPQFHFTSNNYLHFLQTLSFDLTCDFFKSKN